MSQLILTIFFIVITCTMAAEPVKELPASVVDLIITNEAVRNELGGASVIKINQVNKKSFEIIDAQGCRLNIRFNNRLTKVKAVGQLDCSNPEDVICEASTITMISKDGHCIEVLDRCHQAELKTVGYQQDHLGLCTASVAEPTKAALNLLI